MPETVLSVGGRDYGGWTEIRIQRGIEQIAGAFDLTVTERWGTGRELRQIKPGEACQVRVDGVPVITGYVDAVRPAYDARTHSVTVSGRDRTADLVDCSAVYKSGQWAGRTLAQIAGDLAQPFGISVTDRTGDGEKFPAFALHEGETVFEAIERAARMRSVLLISDGLGNLVIDRAGTARAATDLVQGRNILSASAELTWKERYSSYTVKGQAQGTDNAFGAVVSSIKGVAIDAAINRYRPLIVLAEDQGHGVSFKRRAEWERNVRMGRGNRATVSVQGWSHSGGLWLANQRTRLTSALLDVDAELVIASVELTLDDQGTRAQLSLSRPEAFDVIDVSKKKKTKESVWP